MKRFTLTLLAAFATATTIDAQPAPRDPELARAFGQIRAGDPEAALQTLDPLVRRWSREGGGERALAHLCQGIAHAMLNAEPTARGAFREALRLDPSLALDAGAWPPKVLRTWNAVRAEAPATLVPRPARVASTARPAPSGHRLPIGERDPDVAALLSRIEQTMNAGNPAVLDAAFDRQALDDVAMAGQPGTPLVVQAFRQSTPRFGAFGELAQQIANARASFKLLRVRPAHAGRVEAVFRTAYGGGATYHILALERDSTGPRVVDSLSLNDGRWDSEALREYWTQTLESARTGVPNPDIELSRRLEPALARIRQLQAAGDFAGALAVIAHLSPADRTRREMLLLRVMLAHQVGGAELLDAATQLETRWPDDPSLDMVRIGAYTALGQYPRALSALAAVQERIGGDAFLDATAAGLLFASGDRAGARDRATRASQAEPDLQGPWEVLAGLAVVERDHAEVARALRILENQFGYPVDRLLAHPNYAEFVASPEYASWRATRPGVSGGVPPAAIPLPEPPPPPAPIRVGGEIKEPRKLRNVPPIYPDIAKQARVQGVVILECTISPQGRVSEVSVLRGIPLLDQAAIDAVKQWIYTPTLLNGVPVPVIMAVTVTFRLGEGAPASPQP